MWPQPDDPVILIGVAQLLKQHIVDLQSSGQHHTLLIVDVVIGRPVNEQQLFML